MKFNALKLMLAAGMLAAVTASASAQWIPAGSPFAGPYTPNGFLFQYASIDLSGPTAPAGTYSSATISAFWGGDEVSFDNQFQSDQRIILCSGNPAGGTVIVGTAHRGSSAPQGALDTGAPGTLTWNNLALAIPFEANGANTLFLGMRSVWDGELNTDWTNVAVSLSTGGGPVPCTGNTEVEPNDPKGSANTISNTVGATICGITTGTAMDGTLGSYDYFKVQAAPHAGIRKHRLLYTTENAGQFATTRIISQTAGVPDPADDFVFTFHDDIAAGYMQWYTFGNSADANARTAVFRTGGTADSSGQYHFEVTLDEEVVPATISRSVKTGSVTLTSVGVTTFDTEVCVLDSNFNIIPGYLNDDELGTTNAGFSLTRSFAPGDYYIMVSGFAMAVNEPSPTDDDFRDGDMTEFPGTAMTDELGVADTLSFKITDADGDIAVTATTTEELQIMVFKMTVIAAGNGGCQPADICDDTGAPLPSAGSNTGVNEGDYNGFFGGFFDALSYCDQWDDAGNPLPSAGTNSGVNEGDYNGFFATFFNGCP